LHGDTPVFWSPVTGRVAYERYIGGEGTLWTTAPGEGGSRLVFRGPYDLNSALSRDGKWLAFEWRRITSTYIYVSPFRSRGTATELSVGDAHKPVWSGDDLFFSKGDRVLVSRLRIGTLGGQPTFSEPMTVYDSGRSPLTDFAMDYAVMPAGASVLVTVSVSPEIVVVPDVTSRRIP